ncbi:MAG: SRPBCC domain-containing protein [Cyanobacteria bacterium J06621_8]
MNLQAKLSLMPGWTTDIVINAPSETVWQQVTYFASNQAWNPLVLQAQGDLKVGGESSLHEDLAKFAEYWLRARFLNVNSPQSFVWEGHWLAPFLFKVRQKFTFEAISKDQTRLTLQHKHSGLFVPYLALRGVYSVSHKGHLNFNQALKEYCESLSTNQHKRLEN